MNMPGMLWLAALHKQKFSFHWCKQILERADKLYSFKFPLVGFKEAMIFLTRIYVLFKFQSTPKKISGTSERDKRAIATRTAAFASYLQPRTGKLFSNTKPVHQNDAWMQLGSKFPNLFEVILHKVRHNKLLRNLVYAFRNPQVLQRNVKYSNNYSQFSSGSTTCQLRLPLNEHDHFLCRRCL